MLPQFLYIRSRDLNFCPADVYIYIYMYVCMYVCMYVYIYIYIYIHMCMYVCVCVYISLSLSISLSLYIHQQDNSLGLLREYGKIVVAHGGSRRRRL